MYPIKKNSIPPDMDTKLFLTLRTMPVNSSITLTAPLNFVYNLEDSMTPSELREMLKKDKRKAALAAWICPLESLNIKLNPNAEPIIFKEDGRDFVFLKRFTTYGHAFVLTETGWRLLSENSEWSETENDSSDTYPIYKDTTPPYRDTKLYRTLMKMPVDSSIVLDSTNPEYVRTSELHHNAQRDTEKVFHMTYNINRSINTVTIWRVR